MQRIERRVEFQRLASIGAEGGDTMGERRPGCIEGGAQSREAARDCLLPVDQLAAPRFAERLPDQRGIAEEDV